MEKDREDNKALLFGTICVVIFLLLLVSFIIVLKNHYTLPSAFIFSLFSVIFILIPIIALKYFLKIKFYKVGNRTSLRLTNFANSVILFFMYYIIIWSITQYIFIPFGYFITPKVISFHPEILIYVIPSLLGLLLFLMRNITFPIDVLEKASVKIKVNATRKDFIVVLSYLKDVASSIITVLSSFFTGILLILAIGWYIFPAGYQTIPISSDKVWQISLILAIIYSIIDFVINYYLTTKNTLKLPFMSEHDDPKISKNTPKKYKKTTIAEKVFMVIGIIFILVCLLLCINIYYENKNIQYNNISSNITVYTVAINVDSHHYGKESTSEKVIILEGTSLQYYTPLVLINNKSFPLSSKINFLLNDGLINAELTHNYLNKNITPIQMEVVFTIKNNTVLQNVSNGYFTTEYDDYIYLELCLYNYTNITILTKDYSLLGVENVNKIIYARNGNSTFFSEFRTEGESHEPYLTLCSDNDALINDINYTITSPENYITVVLCNETPTKSQVFNFIER